MLRRTGRRDRPVAGSAYGYAYSGIGEFIAWIIGWDLILEYAVATSTVAIGWSGYFGKIMELLGVHLPHALTNAPLDGGIANVPAMVIVLLLSVLLSIGVSESARFNTVMVFVKLAAVVIFIVVAAPHINPANWHPFIPPQVTDAAGQSHFGMSGILTGGALIFFAYIGFDAVSTAAEETVNPQRNLPIGIIASLVICTILYIVVSGHPYRCRALRSDRRQSAHCRRPQAARHRLGRGPDLDRRAGRHHHGHAGALLRPDPSGAGHVARWVAADAHGQGQSKTQHPVRLILGAGVAIALIAGLSPIGKVAQLVNLGTLSAFFLVCASVIVLRKTRPELKRPFPYAVGAGRAAARHGLLRLPHGRAPDDHLASLFHLVRGRAGDLLPLLVPAQRTRQAELNPGSALSGRRALWHEPAPGSAGIRPKNIIQSKR